MADLPTRPTLEQQPNSFVFHQTLWKQTNGEFNPMMRYMTQDDSGTGWPNGLHDLTDSAKVRAVVRRSIAQTLAAHFPPAEDLPPELQELLDRLDKG